MKTRAILALTALAAAAGMANAQALQVRFSNGTNAINAAPGAAVPVSIYATGMPAMGTNIPWTTPPGTGQVGQYAGFLSALFNVNGSDGTWSGLTIAPPFVGPPFGNAGTASGSNVTGVNIGVGFGAPVTAGEFLMWSGTVTVGTSNVNINPVMQPTGGQPAGFEVALSGIVPNLIVSHFLANSNGPGGTITVPAPASLALLGLGGLVAARRRRA